MNELDWKETSSPDNKAHSRHISAFVNQLGGRFLAFGIIDKNLTPSNAGAKDAKSSIEKHGWRRRDALHAIVAMGYEIKEFDDQPFLFFIKDRAAKPVYFASGAVE